MKRVLIGVGIALVVLSAAVVYVYNFGTPQSAATGGAAATGAPSAAAPGDGGAPEGIGGEVDPDAVAPEPDPRSPLAIEIPGCRCHSDDPKLVESHADYRMNQCAGCHTGGGP